MFRGDATFEEFIVRFQSRANGEFVDVAVVVYVSTVTVQVISRQLNSLVTRSLLLVHRTRVPSIRLVEVGLEIYVPTRHLVPRQTYGVLL